MKTLLLLSLTCASLLAARPAAAQAVASRTAHSFAELNLANSQIPAGTLVASVATLSPTSMWGLLSDPATRRTNQYVRTSNAAGTQFVSGPIGPFSAAYDALGITAVSSTTALVTLYSLSGGGAIARTTDGGQTWAIVTTPAQFQGPDGFPNLIHMFNASEGIAAGEPTNGTFEILRTTDGGATWTRITAPAQLGVESSGPEGYSIRGNTMWLLVGTPQSPVGFPGTSRVLKSTDKGLTWTAETLPFRYLANSMAFRDEQNGLCLLVHQTFPNAAPSSYEMARTTDGGTTWTSVATGTTPLPIDSSRTNSRGRFHYGGLTATCTRFVSYGASILRTSGTNLNPNRLRDYGYSTSLDGITWQERQDGRLGQDSLMVYSMGLTDAGLGYAAGITDASTGVGGIYQATQPLADTLLTGTCARPLLAARSAAAASPLRLYPNPSADGHFTVALAGGGLAGGATLRVTDALGRLVQQRALAATTVAAPTIGLDLSRERAGVYVVEVRTATSVARQRAVVE